MSRSSQIPSAPVTRPASSERRVIGPTPFSSLPPRLRPQPAHLGGVQPVDLTGRSRQLRSSMDLLARVAARFCRSARNTLPFLVRLRAKLQPGAVAIVTPSATASIGEGPRYEVVLGSTDTCWAKVTLDSRVLAVLLEGALGGTISGDLQLHDELTLAQRALVARVAHSLGEDLASALRLESGALLPLSSEESLGVGEEGAQAGGDALTVSCVVEGIAGSASIDLVVGVESLDAPTSEAARHPPVVVGDPRMAQVVRDVPIEVVAELGRARLGLRRVMSLKVGDVIRLDSAVDGVLVVRVEGANKLTGVPVVSRGQMSIEIRGEYES